MCGIVGLVGRYAPAELATLLARMNERIVHRGPDDAGSHIAPGLGLAMRRLSIIDLAGGHQPMATGDGVSIVFNGEIYNFQALRQELEARGYVFRTRSDTEVILNLYHAEGTAGFRRLNGMFAVAIHDARSDELVLVRDQIGIKPLYYLLDGETLLFASEIKAILAALPGRPAVNPEALWDYLSLRYVPPPTTIWQGILKLQPGHVLRYALRTREVRQECFWRPDLTPAPFDPGRDYAREFEAQFMAAVQSHIVASDVPVGAFLSGGLDSGALCAAAVALGHRAFHTFSIGGVAGGDDDELGLARQVAERLGTIHHEVRMTPADFFEALDTVAWHCDEPYGDETGIALLLLSRLARRHVKVVLSGEGADELLLGYERPMPPGGRLKRLYRRLPPPLLRGAAAFLKPHQAEVLRTIAAGGPGASRKAAAMHIGWTLSDADKEAFWRGPRPRPTRHLVRSWYTLPTTVPPEAQMQQADFQTWLVEDLLMKADKMAMATSLEARVPFLHLPFVEWCQATPLPLRLAADGRGGLRTKAILREFVARRLPEAVLAAPKRGFPLPNFLWLREKLAAEAGFRPQSRSLHDWIDSARLAPLVADALAGRPRGGERLWNIVMLDRWCRAYLD